MIGNLILTALKANSDVVATVGSEIYPLVARSETTFPRLVYVVESIDPGYNKDGWEGDECLFSISCITTNYSDATELAGYVRTALEMEEGTIGNISVNRIGMDSYFEDFDQDDSKNTFTIELVFRTNIKEYI